MKPVVGSVVGPTSDTHWGQVLLLPNAYGIVEVSYGDGGARASGIHLLSKLGEKLSDQTVSLKRLETIAKETVKDGVKTILLCAPVGHVVYIVLVGGGDVYLKRDRQFAKLLSGEGAISGEVQVGDTIILASEEFSHTLTQEEAGKVFDHLTPTEVAERLTLLLHEKSEGTGSAALVLQFQEGEAPLVPAPIFPTSTRSQKARQFIAHFHPRRVKRHLSVAVLRDDIRRLRSHPKKATALLTAALLVLFSIAVVAGIWKQSALGASPAVVSAMSDARHALDEGVALASLNPVKGRERLVTAKNILEPLTRTVSARSQTGRQILDLMRQVSDNLTQSMQVSKVKPDLFFDAGLIKKGATISFIGLEGTEMGLVDAATQTVYALDVTSKNATVLGGGAAYAGLSYAAIHGDSMYVLVDSGINMAQIVAKKTVPAGISKDAQWGAVQSLVSFGGNLYLLDTQKSRIWKYVATDKAVPAGRQGFSELREYLNPDTLPDLSQATSLAIDGSVWLGSANGKLWKFTGGKEDTFTPQGVDPPFGTSLMLYTSDEVNNLYVLDNDNKRVVAMGKDGTYLSQYVWADPLTPTQFAVSESEKKIYLLAGGKLYAIPLK